MRRDKTCEERFFLIVASTGSLSPPSPQLVAVAAMVLLLVALRVWNMMERTTCTTRLRLISAV